MCNQRRELGGTVCGSWWQPLIHVVWPNPCVGVVGVDRKVCLMCSRLGCVWIDCKFSPYNMLLRPT